MHNLVPTALLGGAATIQFSCAAPLSAQSWTEGTITVRGEISYEGGGRTNASYVDFVSRGRTSGTISLNALLHPVPPKARKQFLAAQKSFKEGNTAETVKHLQQSLAIFPQFLEAHNDLGVQYLRAGNLEMAASEFKAASDLDPKATVPAENLALTYLRLKRYDEASVAAQLALAADARCVRARYALGLVASVKCECTPIALHNLEAAYPEYPSAHLFAARILACRSDLPKAVSELKTYLATPNAKNRSEVEHWMASLQAQMAAHRSAPGEDAFSTQEPE